MVMNCRLGRDVNSNKAFTLVELLGVMVILGLLLIVTVPSITKTLKNKKEEEYNRFLNDLYLATESYIGMRSNQYQELVYSNKAAVELKELIDAGYISANKTNPKTKEKINPLETIIITKKADGTYGYALSGKENGFSSYIKDGLLIWYDGKKHGNNEYIWEDLSNHNRDGILKGYENNNNTIWKNNGLEFDGINDYVEQDVLQPGKITLEATVYIYGKLEAHPQQMIITNVEDTNGFSLYFQNDSQNYRGSARLLNDNSWNADSGGWNEIQRVIHVAYSYDGSVAKVYHNGNLIESKNYTDQIHSSPKKLRLGSYHTNTGWLYGNLKSVKIYDRALSDNEIKKNYEIEAYRFGI